VGNDFFDPFSLKTYFIFFKFNSTCYVPGSFGEVYRGEWHGTVSFFSQKIPCLSFESATSKCAMEKI
jgi:hypothetical protein